MNGDRLPFAAIVGDHLRHRWLVAQLAAHPRLELRGIVCERQPAARSGGTAEEDALIADHFARRSAAEERYFGGAPALDEHGVPALVVDSGQSNDPEVAAWVGTLGAGWLALFGCSIIREPLLTEFEGRTVNIHLGLSPYYIGHATNFWPLVNGEPECVGATVHLATLSVDAGPILRQARPEMAAQDDSHDIGCKAVIAGVAALGEGIVEYATGSLEPVQQGAQGRVYRRADFTPAAVARLRSRFADGMIQAYLAERQERDARFPIVE
jgi:folate-dependent phosphoribosylglycinamide formyltransferase PurN